MLIQVTDVDYIKDYQLALTFNHHIKKIVDLKEHLKGELFEPLKDLNVFRQYGLTIWTIEWVNGVDFAPEFLYKIGKKLSKNSQLLES